ncbi:unnamed protein product [Adineta ricciae]|uniref:Uncharacterized protein n=1 Tax=Adineta ricciae TaxID=249248 RepID=A0A813RGS0_ADIRI|nr:unnamed protein product [Adineta ricciae]
MNNQEDNFIKDELKEDDEKVITNANQGDTYPISDNESTIDSTSLINTNIMKNEDQGKLRTCLRLLNTNQIFDYITIRIGILKFFPCYVYLNVFYA